MECFMCEGEVDMGTLTCKGCGIVFKKKKDKLGYCYSVDYDNPKTQKAVKQYEEE